MHSMQCYCYMAPTVTCLTEQWLVPCAQATEEDDDEEDVAGGVILAHSMGLGKSLQTIAFLHTFHSHWPGKRSLLLVPSNVMHNWVDEFHRWLPKGRPDGPNELTPSKVSSLGCACREQLNLTSNDFPFASFPLFPPLDIRKEF